MNGNKNKGLEESGAVTPVQYCRLRWRGGMYIFSFTRGRLGKFQHVPGLECRRRKLVWLIGMLAWQNTLLSLSHP
jgi:hypothetical protein